jgi:hypothetical protein
MIRRFYLLAILIFFIFIPDCAGVRIVKITPQNPYEKGIRFYSPYPYLWVTKDTSGNLQASIIWLPNKNEQYAIKIKSGIGSVDTKFTLENGWNLTQFGETRDSKTVEMISALTGFLEALKRPAVKVKPEEAPPPEEFRPCLYKLIFNDTTGLVESIEPVKFKY